LWTDITGKAPSYSPKNERAIEIWRNLILGFKDSGEPIGQHEYVVSVLTTLDENYTSIMHDASILQSMSSLIKKFFFVPLHSVVLKISQHLVLKINSEIEVQNFKWIFQKKPFLMGKIRTVNWMVSLPVGMK
jgi:hypothetical protein